MKQTFVNKIVQMDGPSKFQIIKKIGHGQHGAIYLVSSKNQKMLAMKKIPKLNYDPDHRSASNSELTLLPSLSHPNIVKTFHVQQNQSESTIILEFAHQGDLHSYWTQHYSNKPVPQQKLVKWLCQLSLGLHYLHNKARVLHRDIKTKNILVMANELLKFADFGTAKQLMKHEQFAMTAVGTPYYLSPQAIQLSKYNSKSDIWGLGCVMFELCTGNKPFQAASLRQLMNKIINDPLEELPDIYSEWFRNLIGQMLHKNQEKRPTAEMILEINQVKQCFHELKQTYPEYEDLVYPLTDLKTKKYCQREDKKVSFTTETVKTAKNEQRQKSIRLQIQTQTTPLKPKMMIKRVEGEKFIERSLKSLIEKRKTKANKQK